MVYSCLRPNSCNRASDFRPMSYHPPVSAPKYVPYGDIPHAPGSPPSSPAHIPPQGQYYDPGLLIAHLNRPSSVQSARKAKVVSQYEPFLSMSHQGGIQSSLVTNKLSHELHVARAMPVRFFRRLFSTQSYCKSDLQVNAVHSPYSNPGSSLEQDLDTRSVTSQSSGFSRKQHYYNHHTPKYCNYFLKFGANFI